MEGHEYRMIDSGGMEPQPGQALSVYCIAAVGGLREAGQRWGVSLTVSSHAHAMEQYEMLV